MLWGAFTFLHLSTGLRASPCSRIWPLPSSERCGNRTAFLSPDFRFELDAYGDDVVRLRQRGEVAQMLVPALARFTARIAALQRSEPDVRTRHPGLQSGSPFPEAAEAALAEDLFPPLFPDDGGAASLRIERLLVAVPPVAASAWVEGVATTPFLGANESYALAINGRGEATLTAPSVWGALHGLQSFFQLLTRVDSGVATLAVAYVPLRIVDAPHFLWRGLLIDTARHWLPLPQLKRIVDGLAALKLNVLHWHIVDAQSWPLASVRFPQLHKRGAWSARAIYARADVVALVEYARQRGVRVVPEIDLPAHVGALGLAYPAHVVRCDERVGSDRAGVEHGVDKIVLDLASPDAVEFGLEVLRDALPLFIDAYVHLGGDEIDATCLVSSPRVKKWRDASPERARLGDEGVARALQGEFTLAALRAVQHSKTGRRKKTILWDDAMGTMTALSAAEVGEVTLQIWRGWLHPTAEARRRGHPTINSVDWYLDYVDRSFSDMYTKAPLEGELGGEAASWGEHMDEANAEDRIFGRLPAIAERLWSQRRAGAANRRFRRPLLACELKRLGLRVASPVPNYCGRSIEEEEEEEGGVAVLKERVAMLEAHVGALKLQLENAGVVEGGQREREEL